jgi:hypothetical protein
MRTRPTPGDCSNFRRWQGADGDENWKASSYDLFQRETVEIPYPWRYFPDNSILRFVDISQKAASFRSPRASMGMVYETARFRRLFKLAAKLDDFIWIAGFSCNDEILRDGRLDHPIQINDRVIDLLNSPVQFD